MQMFGRDMSIKTVINQFFGPLFRKPVN